MRIYDNHLVELIKQKETKRLIHNVEVRFKPVPEDHREHVMDPRVLAIAKKKREMFSDRAVKGFRLSNERYRPDKVTYDLCESNIDEEERLISIKDDHMIDIFIFRPQGHKEQLPVMVYLHGGGMIAGDVKLYANQMRLVAERAQAVVIFCEYRLSPETPFPGPIEDAYGCVEWVYHHADELRIDVNRFMVAGDSAGGSLTNACLLLDDKKIIKKAFEIYPAVDFQNPQKQTMYEWSYDDYPIVEEQREIAYSRIDRIKNSVNGSEKDSLYLQGKTSFENPLVSALYATDQQLKSFPPVIVVAAEYDYLRLGSDYFVKRLSDLGVQVESIHYGGCDHGFLDLLGTIVQAEDLCDEMARALHF